MSSTRVPPTAAPVVPPVRRVRHQARDVLALMAFSLTTSVGLAAVLLLVTVQLAPGR